MKKYLAAVALAAALVQPAAAITFPSLTTIYVGSGVSDHPISATVFHCSNVSGATVDIRFLLLDPFGAIDGVQTIQNIDHGRTVTVATRVTNEFSETFTFPGPVITEGAVNIEATNSAVFCTAKVVEPAADRPTGFTLPLVRVNPHPGTVE
jgi:hypothetical protein